MTDSDTVMRTYVQKVLEASSWRCKICDEKITTRLTSPEEKESILLAHLNEAHLQSPYINPDLPDRYRAGYFKPQKEILQDNIKFL